MSCHFKIFGILLLLKLYKRENLIFHVAKVTNSICLIYRLRIAQEIQREQEEIEVQLRDLEARGVLIEKELRGEEQSPDM